MFRLIVKPDRKMSLNSILHGVYRDISDQQLRENLRTILAVLIARHLENELTDLDALVIMPEMYEKGYVATKDAVVTCSYIGFERVSSRWAKEQGLHCVICARYVAADARKQFEGQTHTVQFYF